MNAPFSWPKSSEAIRDCGIAAQLTLTNAREDRRDRLWIARAMSSLPVPVSPVMRTVESVGATFVTLRKHGPKGARGPTISSNIDALSISSRRATFSFRTFSSACFRSSMSVAVVYHLMMAPRSSRNGVGTDQETSDTARLFEVVALLLPTMLQLRFRDGGLPLLL